MARSDGIAGIADKLVTGGLVVTMDDRDTVLEDGAVAVRGPDIVAVGPSAEIEKRYGGAGVEVIDAVGQIVLPGLVNAHTHAANSLYRGLLDDLQLEPWLERLWAVESRIVRPGTVEIGARLAFAEMIQSGITTALDMYFHPEASARVAREVGYRLMTGAVYIDTSDLDGIPPADRTPRGREFLQEYRGDPLITPCVLPHSTYAVAPRLLEEARDLADEYGVLFSTHASETAAELEMVHDLHGCRPPAHLDRLGLLHERCVLAHGVQLEGDEMELLARRGTAVAHCPLSNLKLGSGIAPLPALCDAGVQLALGTDGPVSSNDLDLWPVMRLAAVLQKGVHRDASLIAAREVVAWATRDAGRALGQPVGSLEPGKRADLIVIDRARPHLTPLYDVYSHLVYAVGRGDVRTVLIHGRVVMRDRRLLTVDEDDAVGRAADLGEEIAAAASR